MSTYDLKSIRVDVEHRIRIQLAILVDLDGIDVKAVDSMEYVSQLMYVLNIASNYRTHPFFTLGTFHSERRVCPAPMST